MSNYVITYGSSESAIRVIIHKLYEYVKWISATKFGCAVVPESLAYEPDSTNMTFNYVTNEAHILYVRQSYNKNALIQGKISFVDDPQVEFDANRDLIGVRAQDTPGACRGRGLNEVTELAFVMINLINES